MSRIEGSLNIVQEADEKGRGVENAVKAVLHILCKIERMG